MTTAYPVAVSIVVGVAVIRTCAVSIGAESPRVCRRLCRALGFVEGDNWIPRP